MRLKLFFVVFLWAVFFKQIKLMSQPCLYYIPYKSTNGLMGYCDSNKKILVQPKFQKTYFFQSQKLALISNEVNEVELFGLINEKGDIVLNAVYSNIQLIDELVIVTENTENENKSIYDLKGKQLLPFEFQNVSVIGNYIKTIGTGSIYSLYKYNKLNSKVDLLIKPMKSNINHQLNSDKRLSHFYYYNDDLKLVYVDTTGKEIKNNQGFNQPDYNPKSKIVKENSKLNDLVDYYVYTSKNKKKGVVRYHVLNKKKRDSLPALYDKLSVGYQLDSVFFIGKLNGKYGVVNQYNKTIIPFEYDSITYYRVCDLWNSKLSKVGLEFFVMKSGRWGLINSTNIKKMILPISYDKIYEFECPNYVIIKNDFYGYCQVINNQLTHIIEPKYQSILNYQLLPNGYLLIEVEKNNQIFWINWKGVEFKG